MKKKIFNNNKVNSKKKYIMIFSSRKNKILETLHFEKKIKKEKSNPSL